MPVSLAPTCRPYSPIGNQTSKGANLLTQTKISFYRVPSNVSFEIDDLESEWLYPSNHFDLVHSRMMICSISNWKRMIGNAYK